MGSMLGIGAVKRRTGLSDHLPRVWERRYGAVTSAGDAQAADLRALRAALPRHVEIWLGGRGWSGAALPSGVRRVGNLEAMRDRLLRQSMSRQDLYLTV